MSLTATDVLVHWYLYQWGANKSGMPSNVTSNEAKSAINFLVIKNGMRITNNQNRFRQMVNNRIRNMRRLPPKKRWK